MTFVFAMPRSLTVFCIVICAFSSRAQDASPTPAADDLHTLRLLVEQQSKQIDSLTEQVAKLTQLLENTHPAAQSTPAPVVTEMAPQASPAESPTAAPALPEGAAQHVIAKGETLISIAKHYKVTVAELLKVNKIEDERKLQIGQTLIIPSPKPAESPKQNKL